MRVSAAFPNNMDIRLNFYNFTQKCPLFSTQRESHFLKNKKALAVPSHITIFNSTIIIVRVLNSSFSWKGASESQAKVVSINE